MKRILLSQDVGAVCDASWHVRGMLEYYEGEEIVKGEHPLHKAVVALEDLCIEYQSEPSARYPGKTIGRFLPTELKYPWFAMLRCSRPKGYNVVPPSTDSMPSEIAGQGLRDLHYSYGRDRFPEYAVAWGQRFSLTLVVFEEVIRQQGTGVMLEPQFGALLDEEWRRRNNEADAAIADRL